MTHNPHRRVASLPRHGLAFAALLASVALSACGTLPAAVVRTPSTAMASSADSPLVQIAQASTPEPALSGFRLMPDGFYSLDARIELARRATHSLDLQYYLVANDRTGRLLMRSLRDAALRGVRIRLLVDDLYTAGSDSMFLGLAAFPNVEVRLFNPFCCGRQDIASKYVASIVDFRRLNHRMHNKLFVADGAAAIMGGRNVADEYFTRSLSDNFVDMDVFIIGAVVPPLARIFDAYWNSVQAYPIDSVVPHTIDRQEAQRDFDRLVDDGDQMAEVVAPAVDILGYGPIRDDLDSGRLGLVWGSAVAFADQPGKVAATSAEMSRSMSVQMNIMDRVVTARSEVLISSPYFVPGAPGLQQFADLRRRDVSVTVLTNSLAATDVPSVHAGYARYRLDLLRAGVELHELSPSRVQKNERLMLPGASVGRLHAKAAVIDQSVVYLGSMNLDPRSESTNTELGILVDCPELGREVIRVITVSKLRSSYRVRRGPEGQGLEWIATEPQGDVVFTVEPEATFIMRLKNTLLAPFVPEQLL
jgi:cardiolipin synthase C